MCVVSVSVCLCLYIVRSFSSSLECLEFRHSRDTFFSVFRGDYRGGCHIPSLIAPFIDTATGGKERRQSWSLRVNSVLGIAGNFIARSILDETMKHYGIICIVQPAAV